MTSLVFLTLLAKPMPERIQAFKQSPGPKIYQMLSQTASDPAQNLHVRWRAVTTMGELNSKYFLPDLERALQSREWFMRNAALIAILNQPREVALKWSRQLLRDSALMVRTQAVRNLIGLDGYEAEPELWQEIWHKRNFRKNESLWIRAHIAEALARMASEGRTAGFRRMIQDADERLHRWAIMGLEKSTGFKLSSKAEPLDVQRQKWLSRLNAAAI